MKGKYTLFKGRDQQYYFNLKAPNGEIIGHSEGYTTKQSAQNGIESTRVNSPLDSRYRIFVGRDNQFYFNLSASNGQILLQSEGYVSRQGATNGKESVKRYGPDATVVDQT